MAIHGFAVVVVGGWISLEEMGILSLCACMHVCVCGFNCVCMCVCGGGGGMCVSEGGREGDGVYKRDGYTAEIVLFVLTNSIHSTKSPDTVYTHNLYTRTCMHI